MFSLFVQAEFISKVINKIAKSTLSVLLITGYPGLDVYGLYDASTSFTSGWFVVKVLAFVLLVYLACTLADFIRQWLFSLTVDRKKGTLFDRLWNRVQLGIENYESRH